MEMPEHRRGKPRNNRICHSETPTGLVRATENAVPITTSPQSILISRYIFNEGEIIELAIRPSTLWIFFNSWRVLLISTLIATASFAFCDRLPGSTSWYLETGLLLGMSQLMWSTVKWMSRIHVLTNIRVLTFSGVFNSTVSECPLRRLARVRNITPNREKLLMRGTLELIPIDEHFPITLWQTIRRPEEVERKIRAAVERSHGTCA